jgi:hypothetical protein
MTKTFSRVKILHDKHFPLSTLLPWLRVIGKVTDLCQIVREYVLQYTEGKVLNSYSKFLSIVIVLGSRDTDAV